MEVEDRSRRTKVLLLPIHLTIQLEYQLGKMISDMYVRVVA